MKLDLKTVGLHLIVWLVVMATPLLLVPDDTALRPRILNMTILPVLAYAAIFYVNYLYLIQRFYFKEKYIAFVLSNIVIIVLVISVKRLGMMLNTPVLNLERPPRPPLVFHIMLDALLLFIPCLVALMFKNTQRWRMREIENQERENKHLLSEMEQLRHQIQPHFFFNSLNTIYSLIESSPTDAQKAIHGFGKLMRHMLYESSGREISLQQEIRFLQSFIELMALRIPKNITLRVDLPENVDAQLNIAPLLFLTLVENAFKHGIESAVPGIIDIRMEVEGWNIELMVINPCGGQDDNHKPGLGLNNLRRRLLLLYPMKHHLQNFQENGAFYSILQIDTSHG